jgi:hypothetical protein
VAPPAAVTPEPGSAPASSTEDDSNGGGGVPWKLGLLVPAVVLAGVGVGLLAKQKQSTDPLGDHTKICNDICWLKGQEAELNGELAAISEQTRLINQAHASAREYLRNQLREDYIRSREWRAGATVILAGTNPFIAPAFAVNIPLNLLMFKEKSIWANYFSGRKYWNEEVNEALIHGQAQIDSMRNSSLEFWRVKRARTWDQLDKVLAGREAAEAKLSALLGTYRDITFPPCACL